MSRGEDQSETPSIDRGRSPQFSLRSVLRATSCVGILSTIPGFWPTVLAFAAFVSLLLLPAAGILLGLIALQFPLYLTWKRLCAFQFPAATDASCGDDSCYRRQLIERHPAGRGTTAH